MKIEVARLSEDRELELFEEWNPKDLDLEAPGLSYQGLLAVRAYAQKASGIVKARIVMRAQVLLTCARCYEDFLSPLDVTLNFIYPLEAGMNMIPLDGNIREELILSYSQKVLCRKDCQGLCARCGVNLNEEKCTCK